MMPALRLTLGRRLSSSICLTTLQCSKPGAKLVRLLLMLWTTPAPHALLVS